MAKLTISIELDFEDDGERLYTRVSKALRLLATENDREEGPENFDREYDFGRYRVSWRSNIDYGKSGPRKPLVDDFSAIAARMKQL